jgi:tripartite-type tricarboxylate transporter receptor subunit TctC
MNLPRLFAALALCALAGMQPAQAQSYPSRSIRIINPYTAGGGVDFLLRPIAQKMSDSMKVPVVIDNRPGANGIIAMELGAKAAPDGYTLVAGTTGSMSMNASLYPALSYDPVKDFTPISIFADAAFLLSVHPSVPARTVAEFIALARARPGEISYASFGIGSSAHFGGELLSSMTGIKLLHIPYKGSAPAVAALLAGDVMASFDSTQSAMPYVRAGRLRALGIAGLKRSPAAPEIPTISESGVEGFEVGSWYGLVAPAGTPREIVQKLHGEVVKALALPEVRERILSVGTEPVGNTPEEFAAQIRSDIAKWSKVAREARMRPE